MISRTQVDVRYLPTRRTSLSDLEERCLSWLDAPESAAFQRLVRVDDRRDYLAAHALVRVCVAPILACDPSQVELEYESNGRPYVRGRSIPFSLSHCGEMAACAYLAGADSTAVSVGVDVEPLTARAQMADVARILLCDSERDWIAKSSDADLETLRLWTVKEAVLKAQGTGFQTESGRSPFLSQQFEKPVLLHDKVPARYRYKASCGAQIDTLVVERSHVLSVAIIEPRERAVEVRVLPEDGIRW